MREPYFVCGVALCLLFLSLPVLAAQPIGHLISVQPGVTVEREGKTQPLALKAPIYLQDTLRTDATGKAQIIFADDTAVTVGTATTFSMSEFAEAGSQSTFKGNLLQGFARVVTGKVVENNPAGFSVVTPEGHIGIRGTIFTAERSEGRTTVAVENTMKGQVYVNDIPVPAGFQTTITNTDRTPAPRRMTPADRQYITTQSTIARHQPAGSGANSPLADSMRPTLPGLAGGSDLPNNQMQTATLVDTIPAPQPTPLPVPTSATVTGTLTSNTSYHGTFAFSVNLGSGSISNASMTSNMPNQYVANGGSGSVSGGNFSITGFTGTMYNGTVPVLPGASYMNGSGTLAPGGSVNGSYNLGTTLNPASESGTFNGTSR